jgi:type IV pilus assembly protein PilM
MKLSLPDLSIPSLSSLTSLVNGSVVGIDIGTSSIKAVQLRREHGAIMLDSYGEIALAPYRDTGTDAAEIVPQQIGSALLDLMHKVDIHAEVGGVAVASSAALIKVITTPTRDGEQLDNHMTTQIQKYIPVAPSDVHISWSVIPEHTQENIFDQKITTSSVTAGTQKVLLTAINKEKVEVYKRILDMAGIATQFHEIETFSGARAVGKIGPEAVILADLGASTTKICVVEGGVIRTVHVAPTGAAKLTESLAQMMNLPLEKAEALKREHGLTFSQEIPTAEDSNIAEALTRPLIPVINEIELVAKNYQEANNKTISQIVLFGGGACLKGIEQPFAKLNIPVEIARPFKNTKGPMVLEGRLNEDGPIFANAIGLALRALTGK